MTSVKGQGDSDCGIQHYRGYVFNPIINYVT